MVYPRPLAVRGVGRYSKRMGTMKRVTSTSRQDQGSTKRWWSHSSGCKCIFPSRFLLTLACRSASTLGRYEDPHLQVLASSRLGSNDCLSSSNLRIISVVPHASRGSSFLGVTNPFLSILPDSSLPCETLSRESGTNNLASTRS